MIMSSSPPTRGESASASSGGPGIRGNEENSAPVLADDHGYYKQQEQEQDFSIRSKAVLRRLSLHDRDMSPLKPAADRAAGATAAEAGPVIAARITPPRVTKRPKMGVGGLPRMGSAPLLVEVSNYKRSSMGLGGGQVNAGGSRLRRCGSSPPGSYMKRAYAERSRDASGEFPSSGCAYNPGKNYDLQDEDYTLLDLDSNCIDSVLELDRPNSPVSVCSESSLASGVGALASLALNCTRSKPAGAATAPAGRRGREVGVGRPDLDGSQRNSSESDRTASESGTCAMEHDMMRGRSPSPCDIATMRLGGGGEERTERDAVGVASFQSRRRNTVLGVNGAATSFAIPSFTSPSRGGWSGISNKDSDNAENTPMRRRKFSVPHGFAGGRRASVGMRPTPPKSNVNPFAPLSAPSATMASANPHRESPATPKVLLKVQISPRTPMGSGSGQTFGGIEPNTQIIAQSSPMGTPVGGGSGRAPETPKFPGTSAFGFTESSAARVPPTSDIRNPKPKVAEGFFIRRASQAATTFSDMDSLIDPSDEKTQRDFVDNSEDSEYDGEDVSVGDEDEEAESLPPLGRFLEDFQVLESVGAGSFGQVFKVQRRLDGCLYAVKRSQRQSRGDLRRQSMLNEVFALAALCTEEPSPHILQYHNAWIEDERLYIQTELCDTNLEKSLIARGGGAGERAPLPVSEAHTLLRQMLLALEIVHRRGMVHLDIKPGNIFLKGGVYKLGDFGLVTRSDNSGNIVEGDARYMSKELLEDKCPHLAKADIFSLGITLYEAVTAKSLPVNGPEWQALRSDPGPDFFHGEGISSPSLVSILTAALHASPESRPEAAALLRLPALQSQVERMLHYEKSENARLRAELRRLEEENRSLRAELSGGSRSVGAAGGVAYH